MIVEARLAANQGKIKDELVKRLEAEETLRELTAKGMTDEKAYEKRGNRFTGGVDEAKFRKAKLTIKETSAELDKLVDRAGDLQKELLQKDLKGKSNFEKKLADANKEADKLMQTIDDIINKGGFKDMDVEEMEALEKLFPHDKFNEPYDFTEGNDMGFVDLDALDMQEEIDAYMNDLNKMIEHTEYMRTTVGGAFADLGNVIATNLGRNGDAMSAFLGAAIGTYTKLLATNKAFLAKLIPIKKTEAAVNATASATETASKTPFGAFVLPALIAGALAAVSSAFSSAGAGGVSSSGGGGGGNTNSMTVARPNPVRESKNSRMRGSDLIIPMDKVRYGQQIADDNYSGFN